MKPPKRRSGALTVFLLAALGVAASPVAAQSARPFPLPIAAEVHFAPSAIYAAGRHHFIYEIHLTSYTGSAAAITRVDVRAENRDGPSLLVYEGEELVGNMGPLGGRTGAREEKTSAAIDPWAHVMVYMAVPVDESQALPRVLYHQLTFDVESDGGGFTDVIEVDLEVLPQSETVEIGPPLTGGPWVARNGPGNESGHRRAALPTNGRPGLAQRYAIDYMKLDADGRFAAGDSTRNENYASFGQEVIAVADAIVSTTFEGVPENTPFVTQRLPPEMTITTAIGNHVILNLGDGRYVLYAHLKSGSVQVKEGDYVRRGQVLGLVGNTGNSTAPHLHFHLVDRNSPLGAEGLPYTHNAFDWLGTCERQSRGEPCAVGEPERRVGQTPMQSDILWFPERG